MNRIEKIQFFLEGKLNTAEAKAFEVEINNDATLREEVEDYRKIFSGFNALKKEKVKKQIDDWTQDLPIPEPPKAKRFWLSGTVRKMAAAATVLLIAAVPWYLNNISLERFAKNNYIVYEVSTYLGEGNSEATFEKAADVYKKGAYEECIQLTQTIALADSFFLKAKYLEGHAYYRLESYQDAMPVFEQVCTLAKGNNLYLRKNFSEDNARWTFILCQLWVYVETKDKKIRDQMVQEIELFKQTNPSKKYRERAEALLDKLK